MNILKLYTLAATLAVASLANTVSAGSNAEYHLSDLAVERGEKNLRFSMTVNPGLYRMRTNKRIELTPVLRSNLSDSCVVLPPVMIAGRNAWYNISRGGNYEGFLLRAGHNGEFTYSSEIEREEWMDFSTLEFIDRTSGCCGVPSLPPDTLKVAEIDYRPSPYSPSFHYKVPVGETSKLRKLEGKAYVSFPVNRTEIFPAYMNNPIELRKITSGIDSVRFNPDATVKSISLIGFASPEGPYQNNVRLAEGRTEAVKEYVRKQYDFPSGIFHTSSVPEDWQGLREYVAAGSLPDKEAIIGFIDNDRIPIERKNDELRKRFPDTYAFLLKNVYPHLRHTNYVIDYEIRNYTDIGEIRKVMGERPANLSLNEFFIAANSYPVGSPEYDNVLSLAAIIYPDDQTANLNAANAAMNEGDFKRARALLERVGNSVEARYAAAILTALEGNYEEARSRINDEMLQSIPEAETSLADIVRMIEKKENVKFTPEFSDDNNNNNDNNSKE